MSIKCRAGKREKKHCKAENEKKIIEIPISLRDNKPSSLKHKFFMCTPSIRALGEGNKFSDGVQSCRRDRRVSASNISALPTGSNKCFPAEFINTFCAFCAGLRSSGHSVEVGRSDRCW